MKKVLIVEDDKPLAHALELKLHHAGYEVQVVGDGEAALEVIVDNGSFDAILLDLMMPKMDGFAVLENLEKKKISIPVIISTNLSQEEDAERAKQLGAKDYFVKSDTPIEEVLEYVKRVSGESE